ncbi:hypothetical protein L6164_011598 [Bauhinia variegata]|uniref:Uncharacterized protein n=1 Tax=Bauhinia variegata TaxID=167791 RepID=A0ACB9P906_BAUVA|nr:hypothetical protein L6164_011598 [Bauhinia variegata]
MASTNLPPINARALSSASSALAVRHRSATVFKWGWRSDQDARIVASRTRGQVFRISANPNVSSGRGDSNKVVIMVDPVEAKKLAAKQMEKIRAKEKLKRRRQIEAINGAWAMIGLTAGLVIEGQTGKSILAQLAGYLDAIIHIFVP